jgi:hypothetical protein
MIWMVLTHLGNLVIAHLRQFFAYFDWENVDTWNSQTQNLHVAPRPFHIFHPLPNVIHGRGDSNHAGSVLDDNLPIPFVFLQLFQVSGGITMIMHIDFHDYPLWRDSL